MPDPRDPQLDDLRRRARRRLVGAIVLALAAAVLVPMLLESEPKPLGEDVSVKIPPIDDGKFVSKVGEKGKGADASAAKSEPKPETAAAPVSAAPKDAAAPKAAEPVKELPAGTKDPVAAKDALPAKDAAAAGVAKALASAEQKVLAPPAKSVVPPAKDAAAKPAAAPAEATKAPEPAKPVEPGPAATAAPAKGGEAAKPAEAPKASDAAKAAEPAKAGTYSVQLAAFIDDKGANSLAGKLKKAGYPSYVEPYTTSRGTLWRVRVGPYPSREAAEAARTKLKGEGQNGIIAAAK